MHYEEFSHIFGGTSVKHCTLNVTLGKSTCNAQPYHRKKKIKTLLTFGHICLAFFASGNSAD
jgi:hypothetical protein